MKSAILAVSLMIVLACQAHARPSHFLCENFADLTGWNDMYFKNVRYHTLYTIAKNGDKTCLRAESFRSASGLILKTSFNVYEYSKLKWRWKVENVYAKGDHKTKEGDDYPMRIYVVFKDEGFLNSIGSAFSADSLSGKTLIYIWDNKETTEKIVTSPHYSKSKMIIKESGSSRLGQWIDEEANITEDYNAAFGKYPPETASIAIMNDADDTQEASTSYLDLLEVYRD